MEMVLGTLIYIIIIIVAIIVVVALLKFLFQLFFIGPTGIEAMDIDGVSRLILSLQTSNQGYSELLAIRT
jgi:hypothetical protein